MKHETEDQNRIEKRDRVINLQVNRPGIFGYLFDLGRILASWVILGELFSSVGLTFSILKSMILMCLPGPAQIHHPLYCFESLS